MQEVNISGYPCIVMQVVTFFSKAVQALLILLELAFKLLDTRMFDLYALRRLGGTQIERLPLLLPTLHRLFSLGIAGGGTMSGLRGLLQLWFQFAQGGSQLIDTAGVVVTMLLRLTPGALRLLQLFALLLMALPGVAYILLKTGNVFTNTVEMTLDLIEFFGLPRCARRASSQSGLRYYVGVQSVPQGPSRGHVPHPRAVWHRDPFQTNVTPASAPLAGAPAA